MQIAEAEVVQGYRTDADVIWFRVKERTQVGFGLKLFSATFVG
jgi:hypothetical protein